MNPGPPSHGPDRIHDHGHGFGHRHSDGGGPADFGVAFRIGIALNLAFVIKAAYGFHAGSVALISDAGHNLGDVLGLGTAWFASALVRRAPSERYTYGLRGSSILAALFNAVFLMATVGALSLEAIQRLAAPSPVASLTMMVVAAIGVAVNGASAALFASGRKGDLNIRGAFRHMASDAIVSAGVVLAGLVILITGWLWLDPAVSLAINVAIAWGTWGLLRESLDMSMSGVPAALDAMQVRVFLASQPGVESVHDLHVWSMSTTETALTCHLAMPAGHPGDAFLHAFAANLATRFRIGHSTVQIEIGSGLACALAPDEVVQLAACANSRLGWPRDRHFLVPGLPTLTLVALRTGFVGDIGGWGGLNEGLGLGIAPIERGFDCGLEFSDAAEDAAADGGRCAIRPNKRSTGLIQEADVGVKWRRKRGWRSSQALTVGCVRVAELSITRCRSSNLEVLRFDGAQQAPERPMAMAGRAFADDLTGGDVERRGQGCRPVSLVVVGRRAGATRTSRPYCDQFDAAEVAAKIAAYETTPFKAYRDYAATAGRPYARSSFDQMWRSHLRRDNPTKLTKWPKQAKEPDRPPLPSQISSVAYYRRSEAFWAVQIAPKSSRVLTLTGDNAAIREKGGSLQIQDGERRLSFPHSGRRPRDIVVAGRGGFATISALRFCDDYKIALVILDWMRGLMSVALGNPRADAELVRAECAADALPVARGFAQAKIAIALAVGGIGALDAQLFMGRAEAAQRLARSCGPPRGSLSTHRLNCAGAPMGSGPLAWCS